MDKYIKTQDLIDLTAPVDPEDDGSDGCTIVTQNLSFTSDEIEALVDSIPAADVEPVVHGKWLSCFEDWRMQIEGDKCSICGFEHYGTPRGTFKFCPNCGAKMDRKKEGK